MEPIPSADKGKNGGEGGRDARRELNGRRRGRRGSTLLAPILPRPKSEDQPNLPAHSSSGGKPDSRDALGGGEVGTCCEGGRGEKKRTLASPPPPPQTSFTPPRRGKERLLRGRGGLDRPEKRESEHEHAAPSDRGTTGERRRLQTSLCPISGREGERTGVEAARREKEKRQGRKKMKKRFFWASKRGGKRDEGEE